MTTLLGSAFNEVIGGATGLLGALNESDISENNAKIAQAQLEQARLIANAGDGSDHARVATGENSNGSTIVKPPESQIISGISNLYLFLGGAAALITVAIVLDD